MAETEDQLASQLYERLAWIQDEDVLQNAVCWAIQYQERRRAAAHRDSFGFLLRDVIRWIKHGNPFDGILGRIGEKRTRQAKCVLSERCRRRHGVVKHSLEEPADDWGNTFEETLVSPVPDPYHEARRKLDWTLVLTKLKARDRHYLFDVAMGISDVANTSYQRGARARVQKVIREELPDYLPPRSGGDLAIAGGDPSRYPVRSRHS